MENVELFQVGSINFMLVKQVVAILRTLNNAVCQRIFKQLEISDELTVTQIYGLLNLEQSVASMHLAKMRRHRIVSTKRKGKNIFYTLNIERLANIVTIVKQLNTAPVA